MVAATLNGDPWSAATVIGTGNLAAGTFTFGGTNTLYGVTFIPVSPATQGPMSIDAGHVSIQVQLLGTSQFWGGAGSTGSVTFTSLANGYAIGTFEATLTASGGGAAGTVTLVGGTFEARIP